ncbi:hypothetical protein AB0B86_01640 [Micromonospora sp. NPDC049047]|uniref:hypothetical protein n=1 Tax=Micromonospora sp. NPDC049047 TaxID=3155645 RepID=UPI0033F04381
MGQEQFHGGDPPAWGSAQLGVTAETAYAAGLRGMLGDAAEAARLVTVGEQAYRGGAPA